jgi:hypothetical protein
MSGFEVGGDLVCRIVASEQTRTLYAQGALPVYFSHTLGAFKALLEKHLPVRVLTEYDLEDANLEGIRVLALPNVACLSDRAAEVVRRFVRNGGGLIATFETSLYDENFQKRADFALGDLFRAKYAGTQTVTQRVENLSLTLEVDHPIVSDPIIKAKQNTAWLIPGNPPDKGTIALIASAAKSRRWTAEMCFQPSAPMCLTANRIRQSSRPSLGKVASSIFPRRSTKACFSTRTSTCARCWPTPCAGQLAKFSRRSKSKGHSF